MKHTFLSLLVNRVYSLYKPLTQAFWLATFFSHLWPQDLVTQFFPPETLSFLPSIYLNSPPYPKLRWHSKFTEKSFPVSPVLGRFLILRIWHIANLLRSPSTLHQLFTALYYQDKLRDGRAQCKGERGTLVQNLGGFQDGKSSAINQVWALLMRDPVRVHSGICVRLALLPFAILSLKTLSSLVL